MSTGDLYPALSNAGLERRSDAQPYVPPAPGLIGHLVDPADGNALDQLAPILLADACTPEPLREFPSVVGRQHRSIAYPARPTSTAPWHRSNGGGGEACLPSPVLTSARRALAARTVACDVPVARATAPQGHLRLLSENPGIRSLEAPGLAGYDLPSRPKRPVE